MLLLGAQSCHPALPPASEWLLTPGDVGGSCPRDREFRKLEPPLPRDNLKNLSETSVRLTDRNFCGEGIYPRWAAQQTQGSQLNLPDTPRCQVLGPLRAPAGINPLATTAR